ncbi:hypothetical protein C8R47DRAFT_1267711 [Mycena vitilis]|nr:hypothetical protein C8R47DRAFT_1267711 [Mycena vitilis]
MRDAGMDETEEEVSFGTCIVCQEDLTSARPFGTLGKVQPSRFIRRHPDNHDSYLNDVLQTPASLDRVAPNMPHRFTRFGLHASFIPNLLSLLGIDQGIPKAFKLDVWAVDDHSSASYLSRDWVFKSGLSTTDSRISGLPTLPSEVGVISMRLNNVYMAARNG